MGAPLTLTALDRVMLAIAPHYALNRIRARALALRHFEAAQIGRRTDSWRRSPGDANAENGPSLSTLRQHARDLIRNNSWARNGQRVIGRNAVGWGLLPKPATKNLTLQQTVIELWKRWGSTTECDSEGRSSFYGLQRQIIESVTESGEVLIRRRRRLAEDGLAISIQLQVLEPDYLDTGKDGVKGPGGGPIVQGVEYSLTGRRVAYWLYGEHPGASTSLWIQSKRVPAEDIAHVFKTERPGQVRGISWFAPVIVTLKDLDEYEDATLMRQKIAACFSGFITDVTGDNARLGGTEEGDTEDLYDLLEPGMLKRLKPGEDVSFSNPPLVNDYAAFTAVNLRKISAGLGVTYEDLTNDYSQVNFSSARMSRLAHWGNIHDWRWNMLVPQFCDRVWDWAMEAAVFDGSITEAPAATWTPPPMPMLEPDKEGLAYSRLVRAGVMTHNEMVREQGNDPDAHWLDYAEGLKVLDARGIVLDSDVRKVSQAGLTQERAGGTPKGAPAEDPVAAGED